MRFLAPRHGFWAAADQCAEAFPVACVCPEPAPRNGVSLAHDGYLLSKTSTARSTLPACCFGLNSELLSDPFEPRFPASFRFRAYGADHHRDSVAGFAVRNSRTVTSSHSPSGLSSFRIDVLTASGLGGSPSLTVRSPFAPRLRSFFIIPACGSSFAARCCSRGLLFLPTSWNHPDNAPKRILSQ